MDTPYLKQIQEIIRDVEKFIYNDELQVTQRASYILGSTMMRDDYWDIIEIHDDIEEFAELGSSTETVSEEFAIEQGDLGYMQRAFERLKAKYGTGENNNNKETSKKQN